MPEIEFKENLVPSDLSLNEAFNEDAEQSNESNNDMNSIQNNTVKCEIETIGNNGETVLNLNGEIADVVTENKQYDEISNETFDEFLDIQLDEDFVASFEAMKNTIEFTEVPIEFTNLNDTDKSIQHYKSNNSGHVLASNEMNEILNDLDGLKVTKTDMKGNNLNVCDEVNNTSEIVVADCKTNNNNDEKHHFIEEFERFLNNYTAMNSIANDVNVTEEIDEDIKGTEFHIEDNASIASISSDRELDLTSDLTNKSVLDLKAHTDYDSTPDGYHSSDFEFITESDAEKEILTIKFNKTFQKRDKSDFSRESDDIFSSDSDTVVPKKPKATNNDSITSQKQDSTIRYKKKRRYSKLRRHFNKRRAAEKRQNYIIPDHETYLKLFQGASEDMVNADGVKAVFSMSMAIQDHGIGFDVKALGRMTSEEMSYAQEANETIQIIVGMYPENKSI